MGGPTVTFSVFPPRAPVPRIALPDPHRRKPSLSQDILASDHKEITVTKGTEPPVPLIPKALDPKSKTARRTPSLDGAKTLINSSPESRNKAVDGPRTQARKAPTSSKNGSPDPGSIASSNTLVQSNSDSGRKSPVVPIRSMFPVYNPDVALGRQQYYPQRPVAAYTPNMPVSKFSPRPDYRSQLASPIDQQLGAKTAPHSVIDMPLDSASIAEPRFSSADSLGKLWDATHGTEPDTTIGSFNLEMARTSEATFTFGSTPNLPFYTVTTFDTNEISISKTCPCKRTVTCDVALASIEAIERRIPPADGLVTFIFPKMAAMLAINQSAALAEKHDLAPTHRDEMQAAAMKRAAEQEASHLRYNYDQRRYELEHPAMCRESRDPNFTVSSTSPTSQTARPKLHIAVHQPQTRTSSGKPSITVSVPPASPNASSANTPGMRLSTVNHPELNDTPLASLDFHTSTLRIDAARILELMPSLFAIDSVVTAILAVAIADHTTNVIMGGMELWLPPPRALNHDTLSGTAMSWGAGSAFYATIAEREEAEAEAKRMREVFEKGKRSQPREPKQSRSWFGTSTSSVRDEERGYSKKKGKSKNQKKQVIIEEFDLEKLGHYQAGSRQGEKLPGVTRAILGVLIGGLKVIIWFLTMIVRMLAWVLVSTTRCVTSEKF